MKDAFVLLGKGAIDGKGAAMVPMLQLIGQRGALRGIAAPSVERLEKRLNVARQRHISIARDIDGLDVPGLHGRSFEVAKLKKLKLHQKDHIDRLVATLHRAQEQASQPACQLGSGAYGQVLLGRSVQSRDRQLVAVKIAPYKQGALKHEAQVLSAVQNAGPSRFPRPLFHGKQEVLGEECEVLVMQLLGPSVEALWWAAKAGAGMEPAPVLRLGIGMLRCLRSLHACGFSHNDIKPANFCMGPCGASASRVHLVDFGLCAPLLSASPGPTGHASTAVLSSGPAGTPAFASIAQQQGEATCESDDAASLVYSLVYLMCGGLPWEQLPRAGEILEAKERDAESGALLSRGLPREVAAALNTLWEHAEETRRADALFDHDMCVGALQEALVALEPEAEEAAAEAAGEPESADLDFDWGSRGLTWNERGDIVEGDGTVLHEVAGGFITARPSL